jgi:hypothetical protein
MNRTSYVVTTRAPQTTSTATVGTRIEADLYRGGREDEDGITTGSRLVTKLGRIVEVGKYSLYARFDDGDRQTLDFDGSKRGFPCAGWRSIAA